MANYTSGEDVSLLETMLMPFFTKNDTRKSTTSVSSDLDLAKILAGTEGEFVGADDDEEHYGALSESESEVPLEVIFSRKEGPFPYEIPYDQQSFATPSIITKFMRKESIEDVDDKAKSGNRRVNRCPFHQTRNEDYRNFMEEVMLVKYCSKKVLQIMEDTKLILEQYVEIKNDPGFGRIHKIQAWVWVLKEASLSAFSTLKNDKKRKRVFASFLEQILVKAERNFEKLLLDTKAVSKTFGKVWREIEILSGKAFARFANNLESSFEYEMRTSGYNFFLHRTGSLDSIAEEESGNELNADGATEDLEPKQSLQVRCGVDGVTIRTGKKTSSWIKFQQVDQDRDIMLLCQLFFSKMNEICTKVRKNLVLVNDLLEANPRVFRQPNQDSILQSILKCQNILGKPRHECNFYPKEEAIMLYSLKTTKAAFELVRPLLTEFALSTEFQFVIVRDFAKHQNKLKGGHVANRFPLSLHARFELFIEDTKANTDIILNRYPNIREAKHDREKILKKGFASDTGSASGGLSEPEVIIPEASTDTLYKCPSKVFFAKSAQEMIVMFRKLLSQQHHVTNPNPAHYLFTDIEGEYVELTKELTASRTITPEMLSLCSDPIRNFYNAVKQQSTFKDRMLTQIVYSTQKLIYTDSGNLTAKQKKNTPSVSFWIQALCKIMHIWDFHSLPRHLRLHFLAQNDSTLQWIARLEEALRQFTVLVKAYKEELNEFQDFIETTHGFITWIKRAFNFNPPNEVLEKWSEENPEDEEAEEKEFREDSPKYQLHFQDFDMTLIEVNPFLGTTSPLLSLNRSSPRVQVGLVTTLLSHFDQIVSSAIVNLNTATAIHEKWISLKGLKNAIYSSNRKLASIKHIHQLEDMVLALTFESVRKNLREVIAYVGLLNSTISQFNRMFHTVQLHLEDRGMLEDLEEKRKSSEKDFLTEHEKHDRYLKETVQLLKSSVEAMPNTFELRPETVLHSYLNWAKLAKKDAELMSKLLPSKDNDKQVEVAAEGKVEDEQKQETVNVEETVEPVPVWPISLEQAMMQTVKGKSFFPDPDQFSSGLECWRGMCFQMISTALQKFREMTVTKIITVKEALSSPNLSQMSILKDEKDGQMTVGYTEGLSSLLCFMTEQLAIRDRPMVSNADVKLLKEKFSRAEAVVGKFKKGLNAAEKVLVNNLSLSMASVENRRLPQYLPVLPQESDLLKSHDLEEVGSRLSMLGTTLPVDKQDDKGKSTGGNGDCSITGNFVEIQWNSAHRDKIYCRSNSDSTPLQFSQLLIRGQLRIIHLLLDEIIEEFTKALELVKDAKEDLECAKMLLEKTWKGIGNDMKKRRIAGSGIFVLLKLYRHQVATAVVNLKAVRKTGEEVKYLLKQSTKIAGLWVNEKSGGDGSTMPHSSKNKFLQNLHHLSLSVQLKVAENIEENWLLADQDKIKEQEAAAQASIRESKPVVEIMGAVRVSSSVSIFKPKLADQQSGTDNATEENASRIIRKGILKDAKTDFHSAALQIEKLILRELTESLILLKLPNCQVHNAPTDKEEFSVDATNVMAVLTVLIAVSVDIRFFREVMPQERNYILRRVSSLLEASFKLQNNGNGVLEQLLSESAKIRKSVKQLDSNFRSKFSSEGEFPGMEQLAITPYQQTSGLSPLEFVEHLAADLDGHVWTIACGMPEIGTLIKNSKTLESHAVPNIPLTSKIELLLCIVTHLEKLVSHVQANLDSAKKSLSFARSLLKAKAKEITSRPRTKRRLLGIRYYWKTEDIVLSSGEISEHLQSFARIHCACLKAEENVGQIQLLVQKIGELVQQVIVYISLKFKLEPSVGAPNIDNDVIMRAQNWQTVDAITGIASPPNVPPPVILKKITKKSQKLESVQQKYRGAWENRVMELEVYFDYLVKRHRLAVDVPVVFAPKSKSTVIEYDEDQDQEYDEEIEVEL